MEYVIIRLDQNGSISFYAGARWSGEYPDAVIYSAETNARKMAGRLAKDNEVEVIGDYGLDTEKAISIDWK